VADPTQAREGAGGGEGALAVVMTTRQRIRRPTMKRQSRAVAVVLLVARHQ
jgi:hypothetical protein